MTSRSAAPNIPVFSCAALALLAGCSANPFASNEDDYARRVALSRLREVGPAGIDKYKTGMTPPREITQEQIETARRRFDGLERVDLDLERCRASALQNNLDIKVALIDPTIAAERVNQEEARFESAFTLRGDWVNIDAPTATSLVGSQSENRRIVPGLTIPMRTGGTVTVDLPISKSEDNNSFSTLNPAYTSDLQFSISHPLLRNAGRRANTAQLRILGYEEQATASRTKLEVIRQIAAVDRSYWRLFLAQRELEVRQQQYELAVEQLARAERRQRAGAVAEIEVIRSQAGISDRLEAIVTAQNNLLLQTRELKRIINEAGLEIETSTLITTVSTPDPVQYLFDRPELLARAIDNRMEMLELELQLAADAVRIDFARNQALPLLTLDYTYRINGLGGSMQDTFHTMQRNNFEDWQLGLAAEVPLGNEAAKSQIRQAILSRLARLGTKSARELAIRQEVLNAVDTIEAGWRRIVAAGQSVILNTRALQSEQRQFEVGNSTSTNVLDAATRLADAQLAEVRALAEYQVSQTDLAFATGTLLGAAKVAWEPAPSPALEGPMVAPRPAETIPESLPQGLTEPAVSPGVPAPGPAGEEPPAPATPETPSGG